MKLSLHLKMLLLLLAIALAPLAFVSWLDFQAAEHLGESLAGRTRDALTVAEKQKLSVWVDEKAAWVQARGFQIEQTLRSQARDVERCLASPPASSVPAYFKEDFKRGNLPPGVELSGRHHRYDEATSKSAPIAITYQTQVFSLAPGLTRKAAAADIARLAPMTSSYRFLLRSGSDLIFWQYTGFENGLFCAYPGDGTSPSDYDPRLRSWYQKTKEKNDLLWFGPYVDSVSRELILTASMPVHRPDGTFVGATALDIAVDQLAMSLQLPSVWPKDAISMLVGLTEKKGKPLIHTYVSPGVEFTHGERSEAFDAMTTESSDSTKLAHLMESMRKGTPGTDLMEFRGNMSLWAYGPVRSQGMYLVVIIPYDQVIADALSAQQESLRQMQAQLHQIEVVGSIVVAVVLLLSLLSARAISRPVQELALATRRVAEGELGTRVNIQTHDEIQELGDAFNRMVPQLQERMHLKQSLELARQVQQHLLPAHDPRIPGFDIAGKSMYCDETGGDYYDYFEFTRNGRRHFACVVGDITGHGIPSALLMASARSLLRVQIQTSPSLAALMTQVNAQLSADITGGKFMTLFCLELDVEGRSARWSSAGHDPAIRYNPKRDFFDELLGGSLPLAIDPTVSYEESGPLALQPGEIVVLGTDGVWEAPNPQDQRFGKDGLRQVIRQHAANSAREISEAVMNAVTTFRGTHPQADDITLVVVKIL